MDRSLRKKSKLEVSPYFTTEWLHSYLTLLCFVLLWCSTGITLVIKHLLIVELHSSFYTSIQNFPVFTIFMMFESVGFSMLLWYNLFLCLILWGCLQLSMTYLCYVSLKRAQVERNLNKTFLNLGVKFRAVFITTFMIQSMMPINWTYLVRKFLDVCVTK